jgi:hypothetical protein
MTPGDRVAQLYPQALGTHFSRLLRHAWVTVGLFLNPGHHAGEFPALPQSNISEVQNADKYAEYTSKLRDEFSSRFSDFREKETLMQMFCSPFSMDIDSTLSSLQLEFADFHCDSVSRDKFCNSPILDFYFKCVSQEKYRRIRKQALFTFSIFESTYICEQLFSQMKNTK